MDKELRDIEMELRRERYLLLQDLNELEYITKRKADREAYIGRLIDRKWAIGRTKKEK